MVQRLSEKMPAFEGVASGSTATLRLPIGKTYYNLNIVYGGTTMALANMTEIRVIANNKVIYRRSATEQNVNNLLDKVATSSSILSIPFVRRGLKSRAQEELTAIPTINRVYDNAETVRDLRVEVDINGSAVAPTLTAYAERSINVPQIGTNGKVLPEGAVGVLLHQLKFNEDLISGEAEISNLTRGSVTNSALNRINFGFSAGNITNLKIERDSFTLFDRTNVLNNWLLNNGHSRADQTGNNVYSIDPTENGYGGDPILIGRQYNDFRIVLNTSASGTITIFPDYIGGLGN